MNFDCPHCHATARVEANRLPAGGRVRIGCPSCGQAFEVDAPKSSLEAAAPTQVGAGSPTTAGFIPPHLKTQIVNEILSEMGGRGGGTRSITGRRPALKGPPSAMICEHDPSLANSLGATLQELGYKVSVAVDIASAIQAMEQSEHQLVTVEQTLPGDPAGGMKVLDWLNRLPGSRRRHMYVAYISTDIRTMDTGSAFIAGANLTVNRADVARFSEVLRKGLEEHDELYRVFEEVNEAVHG